MRAEKEDARRQEIEAVAMKMLAENGYGGISMLGIAKAAKASNGTLYNWYGSKAGLFAAIVRRNAARAQIVVDGPAHEALAALGPRLLQMLLAEGSVLLNRAASAEPGGPLAQALAENGRDAVMPRIAALMARLPEMASARGLSPEAAAERYLSLLVGDMQVRRVIATLPEPSPAEITARAEGARAAFLTSLRNSD